MGEIIVDRHLAGAAPHLHAPAHARKAAEGFERLGRLDADMASRATAASAFMRLCAPICCHVNRPSTLPAMRSQNSLNVRLAGFPAARHAETLRRVQHPASALVAVPRRPHS